MLFQWILMWVRKICAVAIVLSAGVVALALITVMTGIGLALVWDWPSEEIILKCIGFGILSLVCSAVNLGIDWTCSQLQVEYEED